MALDGMPDSHVKVITLLQTTQDRLDTLSNRAYSEEFLGKLFWEQIL